MREKLLKLMDSEGLTASRLAELLGIRSSSISHIISERNKPSFDLLQKILKRFPNINPDWLLLDSDQMYRDANLTTPNNSEGALFEETINNPLAPDMPYPGEQASNEKSATSIAQQVPLDFSQMTRNSSRNVKRVIVLFDDHSFESYELR